MFDIILKDAVYFFYPPLHYPLWAIPTLLLFYFAFGATLAEALRRFAIRYDHGYIAPFYRQALYITFPIGMFVGLRTAEIYVVLRTLPAGGLWVFVWASAMLTGFYIFYNRPLTPKDTGIEE